MTTEPRSGQLQANGGGGSVSPPFPRRPSTQVVAVLSTKSCTTRILEAIQKHYTVSKTPKSERQIERESWLIPGFVKFNRWHCVLPSVLVQFCAGSVYAWSIFNKPIDAVIYGNPGAGVAPITFYIAFGLLGLSAAVMGPWLERVGPMPACVLGTSLFFLGNLLTSLALATEQIWLIFVGYGVLGGCGVGLCYISPVSALQKWFPDHRGLAAGFAVCGFGAGSVVLSKVQLPLLEAVGLPLTFLIMGCIYFVVMSLSALVLRTPPPDFVVNGMDMEQKQPNNGQASSSQPNHLEFTVSEGPVVESSPPPSGGYPSLIAAITSTQFRLMWLMFGSNILFGLIIISRLSNIVTDIFGKSPAEASTIVSVNAVFNVCGRFVFSTLSDVLGRKNTYILLLTTQLAMIGLFSLITSNHVYWAFLTSMFIVSACYGGGFSVIPPFLTDLFGPTNIGACHGIILTAWSAAGIGGGVIFTAIFDAIKASGSYELEDPTPYYLNVWWIFGVVLLGWASLFFIKPTPLDQKFKERLPNVFVTRLRN